MSAFYPPYYSFTGINFNSGFFTTPTTGLTETQANAIYLRKTTPDTASALETFTGGIKTDTIDATNPANIITIGASSASTTVSSNLQVDVAINTPSLSTNYVDVENIATPGILTIGEDFCTSIDIGAVAKPTNIKGALNTTGITTATGQIFPNGGLDTAAGSALNIGTTASKTGAINIGTGASRTGIIHIGDGNSVSGAIHIGNGTSASNNVNILNGATSTGSVNIGNNTSGTIIIGGTGAMTLNGSTITMNQPITPSYTVTSSIPSSSQVGYSSTYLSGASFTTSATVYTTENAASWTPIRGVYFFEVYGTISTGSVTYLNIGLSQTSATLSSPLMQSFQSNSNTQNFRFTCVYKVINTTTMYLASITNIASVSLTGLTVTYTRIA
jgi:hypothetical protein